MTDLGFEVILVIVGPAQQGRNKLLEMGSKQVYMHSVDSQLDVPEGRFDNLPVVRCDEYEECCKYLSVHLRRDEIF